MRMIRSFFLQHDVSSAQNLKFILYVFEQMSDLKINFDKSGLSCFGEAESRKMQYEIKKILCFGTIANEIFGYSRR